MGAKTLSRLYFFLLVFGFLKIIEGEEFSYMKNIVETLEKDLDWHFKERAASAVCEDVKIMPNLDVTKFFSSNKLWHEMEKNENIGTSDCASVKMVEAPEIGIYLDFRYQQAVDSWTEFGQLNSSDPNNTHVSVTFPADTDASAIYVLSTDYDSYALIYSCSSEGKERIWILTREKEPGNATQALIQEAITQQGETFQNKLFSMDKCEEIHKLDFCRNKTSKLDLDLSKFSGQSWFEQLRSNNDWEDQKVCANVNYTYDDSKNTMTVLYEYSGKPVKYLAFIVHKNDTGLWFDTSDDNFFYFITDTDYDNYAVVYSCDQVSKLNKIERLWILGKYNHVSDATVEAVSKEYEGMSVEDVTCPLPPPPPTIVSTTTDKSATPSLTTTVSSTQNNEDETTTSNASETSPSNPPDNDNNRPPSYNITGYEHWKFYYLFQLKNA